MRACVYSHSFSLLLCSSDKTFHQNKLPRKDYILNHTSKQLSFTEVRDTEQEPWAKTIVKSSLVVWQFASDQLTSLYSSVQSHLTKDSATDSVPNSTTSVINLGNHT